MIIVLTGEFPFEFTRTSLCFDYYRNYKTQCEFNRVDVLKVRFYRVRRLTYITAEQNKTK